MVGSELYDMVRRIHVPLCTAETAGHEADHAFLQPGEAERSLVRQHAALLDSLKEEFAA